MERVGKTIGQLVSDTNMSVGDFLKYNKITMSVYSFAGKVKNDSFYYDEAEKICKIFNATIHWYDANGKDIGTVNEPIGKWIMNPTPKGGGLKKA